MLVWVPAEDSAGIVLNLMRSIVEQQRHIPILLTRYRQYLSEVAFTPGFDSFPCEDGIASLVAINASGENPHVFALREPPLYELHHWFNWFPDLFLSLRCYRLGESSVQIYPNPPTHLVSPFLRTTTG
jgi:hypothetical protein